MDAERWLWFRQPTRARILDAAEERFAAAGYDAVGIDEVAATAGVSKSHLYYHFGSKAGLLAAVVERGTADLLAAKDALFAEVEAPAIGDDEGAAAALLGRALAEVLAPRRAFVRLVLIEAIRNPAAAAPVFAALEAALDDTMRRLPGPPCPEDARVRRQLFLFGLVPSLFATALQGVAPGSPLEVSVADLAGDLAVLERLILDPRQRDGS